jgi:hypothetical protein
MREIVEEAGPLYCSEVFHQFVENSGRQFMREVSMVVAGLL